jgi:DNA-directed RNA polymerase specialized sigma24 family protein
MSAEAAGAALDFQRVYEEFQPRIRRYLARLAGAAEAEDLTQETFLRVNHALEGFRGDAALATWIYRIATNVATDRLRTPGFQLSVRSAEPEALAALGTVPVIVPGWKRLSGPVRPYTMSGSSSRDHPVVAGLNGIWIS